MTIPENECCIRLPEATNDPVEFLHTERKRRRLPELQRNAELDCWARLQASQMASATNVFHSVETIEELQEKLGSVAVGENVQRGDSVFSMLCESMESGCTVNRSNMLSEHFTQFGSAIAMGGDGKLYFCQVFMGVAAA